MIQDRENRHFLLTSLSKYKNFHPDTWIVSVNINNYTSILHGIKTNAFDEKGAMKLLTETAQIREMEGAQLEEQLFNTCTVPQEIWPCWLMEWTKGVRITPMKLYE
jgi:hypothetical protein